jgi:hypothetical protein
MIEIIIIGIKYLIFCIKKSCLYFINKNKKNIIPDNIFKSTKHNIIVSPVYVPIMPYKEKINIKIKNIILKKSIKNILFIIMINFY